MNIENIEIDKLIPYHNNPRKNQGVDKLASSINEYGFQQPIVVDKNMVVIVGHTRLLGAKKLGLKEVPVLVADLSESKAKAYRIADNRLNEESAWDFDLLNLEIKNLLDDDYNIDVLGFDSSELDKFLTNDEEYLTDEDETPELPKEPISKLGDIYQLGEHRLMCGDSTSIDNLDQLCETKVDMIFTDPPYGINYSGGRTQVVEKKTYGKILNDTLEKDELGSLIALTFSYIKQDADIYICVSPLKQKPFLDIIEKLEKKIDAVIVWDKKNAGLGYMKYRRQCEFILYIKGGDFKKGDKSDFDLWSINRDKATEYVHGTQKPVALAERAINNSSKGEDIVLDCFGGSGSTLIACEKTNRKARLMELDPKYVDVIIKRWENFTGNKAKKIN